MRPEMIVGVCIILIGIALIVEAAFHEHKIDRQEITQKGSEPMAEHTILVAFTVEASTREDAHTQVLEDLRRVPLAHGSFGANRYIESWWVAEDDRTDRSDNDSAVFVHKGSQAVASEALLTLLHTNPWNVRDTRNEEIT